MSRSVDLFIDADMTLDDFAVALRERLELRLTHDLEQCRWLLSDGDVTAVLHEHPYADDRQLPFTRYRFALSARVPNETRPQDSAQAACLRRVAAKIQQGPAWPQLLVLDLQFKDAAVPRPAPVPDPVRSDGAGIAAPATPAGDGAAPVAAAGE